MDTIEDLVDEVALSKAEAQALSFRRTGPVSVALLAGWICGAVLVSNAEEWGGKFCVHEKKHAIELQGRLQPPTSINPEMHAPPSRPPARP